MNTLGQISDLTHQEAKIVLDRKIVTENCNGIPVYAQSSSDYVDSSDIPLTVVGHCERFDLSNTEDRTAYSDIRAKLAANSNLEKTFEQHVIDNSALIVYLAYLEYIKVVEGSNNYER